MDAPRSARFLGLLRVLLRHGVDFLVVGGVAAQLEGAPILTLDLDVLFDSTPENRDRLLGALQELKARYRDPGGRHIEPDAKKLAAVIETKDQANRDKDRAVLPVLRQTLAMKAALGRGEPG
jgi:hypothetical protein